MIRTAAAMGAGSSMRLFGMHAAVLLLVMASSASAFSTGAFSLLPRVSGRGLCSVAAPEPALAFAAAPLVRALPITVMAAAKKVALSICVGPRGHVSLRASAAERGAQGVVAERSRWGSSAGARLPRALAGLCRWLRFL